jgi:uncharacterized protein (TIGR00661 family)
MKEERTALVCPLDWGIGHATRCVPVIRHLSRMGFRVIVASDARPLEFLKREFPGLQFVLFPGTPITYTRDDKLARKMAILFPGILAGTLREHRTLRNIVADTGATLVISDNRFGCWHPKVPSVFITHQIEIRMPHGLTWLAPFVNKVNRWFISRYTECWIPDFEAHRGLAGSLSHPEKLPRSCYYIGSLSRFATSSATTTETEEPLYDLLVMLSGPEPQRTILEEKILGLLRNISLRVAMVRGMTESDEIVTKDGVTIYAHLETREMKELINRSSLIITRSGYSSIMDLVTLGKQAVLIPTPGQTEQEYLARYLMEKKIYFSMDQQQFDLLYAIEMSKNFHGMIIINDHQALKERIGALFP